MTTAFITGIGGFVGSHLAEYLLEHTDWQIVGFMRWNEPLDNLEALAPAINEGKRIRLAEGDLTDSWSIHRVMEWEKPDRIFHLAAQSYVMASMSSPVKTLNANVIGTFNMLHAARVWAPYCRFHNCSSSEVYGKVDPGTPMNEDCPFHPSSPYAISKATADMLGRYHAEAYGLHVLTTRMFTHTGPRRGDVFVESSFAKQIAMIEAGLLEPPIKVGNLEAVRTIADVRDAVRAYHLLMVSDLPCGSVFNIGGDHTCNVSAILEALFDASGFRCEIEIDPERLRPVDADHQVPDCARFKQATGWEPKIPFEQTMADLLSYWRERVKRGAVLQR